MYRDFKNQVYDFLLPAIICFMLMIIFHQSSFDEWMARHFYSSIDQWRYRDNFLLEKIFHKGGVIFSMVILAGFISAFIYFYKKPLRQKEKNYALFVVGASTLTILAVFGLKKMTTLQCPWNTQLFGGGSVSPSIWEMFSFSLPKPRCFPGGHSSAGYAFLSIYFGYTHVYGKRNMLALLPGALMGIIFGLTQQARGAHFISHDMATIFISIICSWLTSLTYSHYNKSDEI